MASEVVNLAIRNSRRSNIGSAAVSCRRTHAAPTIEPDRDRRERDGPQSVLRDRLEAEDERQDRDQGQRDAHEVEPSGRRDRGTPGAGAGRRAAAPP